MFDSTVSTSNRGVGGLAAGPLVATVIWILLRWGAGLDSPACWAGAVTALCGVWWILEPIPIPVTSMIPFAVFPLVGVLTHKQAAARYGDPIILLFLSSFMLSAAMEKSGAHRRAALGLARLVGGAGGRRLVLAFMIAAAVLSMWITNTATVLMLLPIVLAVVKQSEDSALTVPLLLGVAYGASIGGVATPIGSPPNLYFMSLYDQALQGHFEETGQRIGQSWSFAHWMVIGLTVSVVFLPIAWLWLTRRLRGARPIVLPECGPWSKGEVRVVILLAMTALLWMTRSGPFGGWDGLLQRFWEKQVPALAGEGTVALLMVVLLFLIPDGRGAYLLDWETAAKIPWGLLILFGGGLVIGTAFQESGLSDVVGASLHGIQAMPPWLMIGLICLSVTFLTEISSNSATAVLLMPILFQAGVAAGVDPAMLMAPAAISCSFAFMLPVATPPNAIVFGSEQLTVRTMVREGLVLNLVGISILTAASCLLFKS